MRWTPDVRTIALLENAPLYNDLNLGYEYLVFPNDAPEDDGGKDIGFGHKIQKGENFDSGISLEDCWNLLLIDYGEALLETIDFIGQGVFFKLPQASQFLLIDFKFNGVLHLFPKFIRALVNGHYEKAIEESKRYYTVGGKKKEILRRNEMTKAILEDLLDQSRFLNQEVHDEIT